MHATWAEVKHDRDFVAQHRQSLVDVEVTARSEATRQSRALRGSGSSSRGEVRERAPDEVVRLTSDF